MKKVIRIILSPIVLGILLFFYPFALFFAVCILGAAFLHWLSNAEYMTSRTMELGVALILFPLVVIHRWIMEGF